MGFLYSGSFFLLFAMGVGVGHSAIGSKINHGISKNVRNTCSPKTIICDNNQCVRIQHKCNDNDWNSDLRYKVLISVYTAVACKKRSFTSPISYFEYERFVEKSQSTYGDFSNKTHKFTKTRKKPYACNKNDNCMDKFNYRDFQCTYDASLDELSILYSDTSKLPPVIMRFPKKGNYENPQLHSDSSEGEITTDEFFKIFNSVPSTCSPSYLNCDNHQCVTIQHRCNDENWNSDVLSKVLILVYSAAACRANNFTYHVAHVEFENLQDETVGISDSYLNTNGDISESQLHPYICYETPKCSNELDYRDFGCNYVDGTIKISYYGKNKQFGLSEWAFPTKTVFATGYSISRWE